MTRAMKMAGAVLGLLLWGSAQAGTVTYVYTDPQGTPLMETDAQGNITARYEYTPYGVPVTSMGPAPDGVGYTGHVNDPESGFVYMQARYYDAEVGRFLSVDPVGVVPGDAFNFGRFTYANDSPVINIDVDGKQSVCGVSCGPPKASDDTPEGRQRAIRQLFQDIRDIRQAYINSKGKRLPGGLLKVGGIPNGAVVYRAPDGQLFYAPEVANFHEVLAAGKANGKLDFLGIRSNVSQFGKFDFQRVDAGVMGKFFYPAYTDASNFSVGVFMYGAGFSSSETIGVANTFAFFHSSNWGSPDLKTWWLNGWNAAQSGQLNPL